MKKKGSSLILTLVILVGLCGFAFAFLSLVGSEMKSVNASLLNMRTFYIAEAGRARARWALTTNIQPVGWGETDIAFSGGRYAVTTAYSDPPLNQHVKIVSFSYIPDLVNPLTKRTVIEDNILYSVVNGRSTLGRGKFTTTG